MPVQTTTLSTDPVLVQQHQLSVTLPNTNSKHREGSVFSATILTYGATLTHVCYPDRWNACQDVALGFDHWQEYLVQAQPGALNPFFGAIIGRTASRIAHASFILDTPQSVSVSAGGSADSHSSDRTGITQSNTTHTLKVSNGLDCHHGGPLGFDKQHWTTVKVDQDRNAVLLQLVSPNGQNGYPGRLVTTVEYQLTSDGELCVEYWAKLEKGSDNVSSAAEDLQSTIVSLTHHAYWNLDGVLNPADESISPSFMSSALESSEHVKIRNPCSVKDHQLWLCSNKLVELGASHPVPTGNIVDVAQDALLDFTQEKKLGPGLEEIPGGFGYDHVYALQKPGSAPGTEVGIQAYFPETPHVATLSSLRTGIRLDLYTSEPALVVYASGYLDDSKLQSTKSKSLEMPSSSFILSPTAPSTAAAVANNRVGKIVIEAGFDKFAGISLEPIRYPDAIHHPEWSSMVTLHAGQEYRQRSIYKFSVEPSKS
ncbi:aldose 1-epimerase [Entomortierella parvispora]|uniref:Aldose 1-epimerase n=1 Tax=Entomortierella parvispora TaxID=205924 RepID=A0A9P3HGU8_9FUNG|nr:aldose 1-epimerase [Entomortierella parvispora]